MISNSEKFKEEDQKIRLKLESRNELENYIYSFKNSLNDNQEIDEDSKKEANEIIDDCIKWLDETDEGDAELFKNKRKEYEDKLQPFLIKMHGNQMPSDIPSPANSSPNVEDVD